MRRTPLYVLYMVSTLGKESRNVVGLCCRIALVHKKEGFVRTEGISAI